MQLQHVVPAFVLLTLALSAQTETKPAAQPRSPSARAFLPPDYRMIVHADLAALRTRGIWDELEVSLLKVAFKSMEKELGFELAKLDRVTLVAVPADDEGLKLPHQVVVFEGNAPLAPPPRVLRNESTVVGAFEVRVQPRGRPTWFVQPRPDLIVEGSETFVRPALEGRAVAASPCPDVMSLLSGRHDVLAYFVNDLAHPSMAEQLELMFPGTEWPAGEGPSFVCLRVVAAGSDDDPHLAVEAVLRHAKEGEGIARSEQAATALLERLRKMPQLRAALPVLKKLETSRDHGDLVWRVDLGRARDAVGHLATLVAPMLLPAELRSADVPATPADPAPPPPPKAK